MTSFTVCAKSNFDTSSVRLDKDIQLLVPEGSATEVIQYLREHYSKPEVLRKFAPDARFDSAIEDFTDVYYDTSALVLLNQNGEIRHRRRYLNGNKIKEWVQVKFPNAEQYASREVKFDVAKIIAKEQSPYGEETAFPIELVIKNKELDAARSLFTSTFKVRTRDLRPTVVINQTRTRAYVKRDDDTMFTLTVDEVSSSRWWAKAHFFQLEIEANEILFSKANAKDKALLSQLQEDCKKDLLAKFPQLKQIQAPKYRLVFQSLEAAIPGLKILYKLYLI